MVGVVYMVLYGMFTCIVPVLSTELMNVMQDQGRSVSQRINVA